MDENPQHTKPPLRPGKYRQPARAASSPRAITDKRATGRPRRPATKRQRPQAPSAGGSGRRIATIVAIVALSAIGVLLVLGYVAYAQVVASLPDPTHQLKGSDQTSKIFDRKGRLIANLFADENRTSVPLADMPAALRQAVVATEDQRFYQHSGVDPVGILRALVTDVVRGQAAQGGSTITQQYVKNAFVSDERTLRRKFSEAMLAYRVERNLTKDRILELYLNTIYFGHGAYGVETAAHTYFGKSVRQLDVAESAMLAGLIRSPGRYSPYVDPAAAKARRRVVLRQMRDQGYIADATYRMADGQGFKLEGLKGSGTFAKYFVEYVKAALVGKFGSDTVYRGGLRIETSLDLDMQRQAEEAVRGVLNRPSDPSAALVALDPGTGEIRAMVGGRDFDAQQFNVAVQGRRQPGSAFKPFVLAAALGDKVSPEGTFESGAVALSTGNGPVWKVTGAGGGRSGPMRLREAAELSVNSVFAQLILKVGADRVAQMARKLGISTPIDPVPAIALGGLDQGVSPLDMASAYGTFANGGVHVSPRGVLGVKNASGRELLAERPSASRAVTASVAYLVTDMLKGVIARGTGKAAGIGRPAAGKTGTTQAYRDAWFVGYTPQLASAVWVGYPEAQREMNDVHGRKVTGGSFPAEIWRRFMTAALKGAPVRDFVEPSGLVTATICLDTGLLATDGCPRKGAALFLAGQTPGKCTVHAALATVAVPSLVGMNVDVATAILTRTGLEAAVTRRASSEVTSGQVISQDPSAGTKLRRKSTVTLVVSSGAGNGTGPAPRVSFDFEPSQPKKGEAVLFEAVPVSGDFASYVWDFAGTTASGRQALHAFAQAGTYAVALRARTTAGETAEATRTVTVK